MAKEFKMSDIMNKITGLIKVKPRMVHREINLVPDVKGEMIKALKLRNFIFFLCIVVASASVGVVLVVGAAAGGQGIIINGKNEAIEALSSKLEGYSELSELLTIKDQVNNIDSLTDNKKVLSRAFNVLSAIIPTGADTIQISELNVNLADGDPTFSFDAQADAGAEPYIDYRVLDAFRKSMKYLTFDYGRYIDKQGAEIPAYCIIDTGEDGAILKEGDDKYYGLWTIYGEGCDPSATVDDSGRKKSTASDYELETYNDQKVVRIWRTPKLEWYNDSGVDEGQPSMTSDGIITNVAHFRSDCINYKIEQQNGIATKIDSSDNRCKLVPASAEDSSGNSESSGITISDSSNGRDASGKLVLRFSARITFNPEIFTFSNHHVIAFPPSSRKNVTDSYVQLQNIFTERAADCDVNDVSCNTTSVNGD